ncbi:hypothetical protein [Lacticaseibacillus rhamnosus]|uniref:hypothetical protein n=1 Tax=Lacticaseibacillus rhamnosus TaxID=47715 RepID=UPI0022AAC8EE|nr:hypothetical protein [Lacticaseibacillus rhamnosus]MCZ2734380.1 hypothetical protein [Lacticaseibacillus rhamnosus]MCZ2740520.1 hypothetical protein [Lacticaseibacillus rhamnosus]MCZ2743542.1 hypothetical protein [Lacticaseibacillus rhamnosus]MCZ2745909.1 hypothetical protein [Lacticaseibacillus rhamnosus]
MEGKRGSECLLKSVSNIDFNPDVKIQLITGVNLPMIIEAINARMMGKDIDQITDAAYETAKIGIKNFWDELKARNPQS